MRWQIVNDVHSGLNPTRMHVHRVASADDVAGVVRAAARDRRRVAICGGRHAMGGQQFAADAELIDLGGLNRIVDFDLARGLLTVQAGIQWPELIAGMLQWQAERAPGPAHWAIAQKQTGADKLSIGGALAANIHGRGLQMGPIVEDVESLKLIGPDGDAITCSRSENADLFALAIGGYGLFGVIVEATLRLAPRRTLRRMVRIIDIEEAVAAAERRIEEGFLYGDFQFDIDPASPDFLTKGVLCGYCPATGDPPPATEQRALSRDDWEHLITLAHSDKAKAFSLYAQHYLATDGQLYHSDLHQLSTYLDDYHAEVERRLGQRHCGSEVITELYVPPERLTRFLRAAARFLVARRADVIYGTIRLVQPDRDTVLAWARERMACIIFNLHVGRSAASRRRNATTFRGLIALAAELGGSYYLTYHRYATADQLKRCYPRAAEFFAAKRRLDPNRVFQSDWYRYYAPNFDRAAACRSVG